MVSAQVGAQIAFDVDSDRAMKQRAKGKSKGLAGTWSIRGRDLVAVVLETTHGQPLATSDVASARVRRADAPSTHRGGVAVRRG